MRTLQIGEGDAAVGFDQIATPLANSPLPREAATTPPIGHWEEQIIYTDLGVPLTTQAVWVSGPAVANPAPADSPLSGTAPPTNHTTTGAIYLSRDGASATLPDGQVINAGPGGRLELGADGNLSATRPVTGYSPEEAVYSVTLYDKGGQVVASTQVQVVADPAHPNDPAYNTTVVQGQVRDITQVQPDGSSIVIKTVFQTGLGWVEQGTGDIVQSLAQWKVERSSQVTLEPEAVAPADLESGGAINGHDHQSDNHLHLADIPAPELASHFAGGNAGGAYGAGTLGGFDVLPLNGSASFLVNEDGDIAGEINRLPNGDLQIKNLYGEAVYVNQAGAVLSQQDYQQAQTQAQWSQAAGAIGLMNSIIGLQNWDDMGDLQRLAAVTSIYNVLDKMSGGETLPGNLGTAASVLGLLNALDQGNVGGMAYSGLSLVEHLTQTVNAAGQVTQAGWITANLPGGGNFLPGLGFVLALDSGDPVSIASSGLSLMSSLGYIGPWGAAAAVVITLLGAMFADDDQPMLEGKAHAQWDAAGNTQIITDQNLEGGGATAAGWMNSLVGGLQQQLSQTHDAAGNSYALVPNLLPAIGYQMDPDGFNLANGAKGFLYLQWIDESGATQTRYYDGQGNRGDASGETLAGDFMAKAQGAIAPAWAVATTLAHWQQGIAQAQPFEAQAASLRAQASQLSQSLPHDESGQPVGEGVASLNALNAQASSLEAQAQQIRASRPQLPGGQAGLPQELADGIHQTLQALTLDLPGLPAPTDALIDIDADGYLEQTQWLASNQQVLGIDANGDNQIGAGELLHLSGGAALNSLSWLDADGNKVLNASDPAFAALRLWMDIASDGNSQGETQSLSQAGITAIDFGSNPPAVVRSDGSRTGLTAQTLTGDVLGVRYTATVGGVLESKERGETVLHAVNTRQFDGQADHMHGGDLDTDGAGGATVTVKAGDSRLNTTSANTITTGTFKSTQTSSTFTTGDARLQAGAAGSAQTGQAAGQAAAAAGAAQVRSNAIAFVPLGATGLLAEIKQATDAMVRSATPALFEPASGALAAMALGAAAVQWPSLASANAPSPTLTDAATLTLQVEANAINWQALEGSRVSVAAPDDLMPSSGSTANGAALASGLPTAAAAGAYESNQAPAQMEWAPTAINLIAVEVPPADQPFESLGDAAPSLQPASSDILIDYPEVQGEQSEAVEDTVRRFTEAWLLANDSTVNAPAWPGEPSLRITSVFAPVHGSVSLQTDANGATEVVFVPQANYHGPASFSYTVTDQYGLSSHASVSLDVAAVNDAPVTTDEIAAGDEDHTLQFSAASLLANDLDVDSAVDGDVLRITRVGSAQHGQVFLAADGTVSFIPDINYNGPAQFTYWVGDRDPAQIAAGEGYETPATVKLTVLAVNDLPVVTGEVMDSDEDIVLDINPALLLANDTDVDTAPTNDGNAEPAQVLAITAVGNAQHGSIALLADGTLQFTPERNYFGAAGFSYTVDDGNGGQVVGQVVVNLAPVNDAPDVLGETVTFNEDEIQTITQASLLANDSDVDNPHTDLRIVAVDNATHGTVALNPDGSIRFAPAADYFGPAQFTYTVSDGVGGFTVGTASLDIAPVNDAPRLLGESLTLDEDTEASFSITSLLANDHDVDNLHTELSITAATISPDSAANGSVQIVAGEIVFTPTLNFNGAASFTYTVADGVGGSSQATVNLDFTPVNDVPVANSELIWGKRDVSYTLSQAALLANDADVESPNNLQISAISNVQHGSASLNANGSVSFTPETGYAGRGSFDYLVRDPDGATSEATAQIDFSRININPLATDDSFTGYEDVVFSITQAQLLVNDSDADNPAADLRVTAVAGAQNGSVSLDASGTVRFTPAANFYGSASFTYQVSDGEGGSTWAMAQMSVQSVNDAPVIEDIWYGRPIYGTAVQAAGYDESGQPVYASVPITSESQARSLLASGQLAGSSGSYYQNGQLRPVGFDNVDANSGDESGTLVNDPYRQNGGVVAYDPDGNSAQLSFSVGGSPQHGHAWANQYTASSAPGSIDHTQAGAYWVGETGAWQYYSSRGDGYGGADPFTITVTDSGGASANASINTAHAGSSIGGGGAKPVSLDLNGNGLEYIGIDDSQAYFDVNSDGWRERLAWVSSDDGWLVRDIGADRVIDRFDEISFTGYLPGAKTDLEGLNAFDSNQDGLLSRLDKRWQEFGVWQDGNGNGASEAGEVRSLDEIGIVQIGLASDQQVRQVDGVTEFGQSRFDWADGRTGAVGDVALPVDTGAWLPVGPATSAAESAPAPASTSVPALEVTQVQLESAEPAQSAAPPPFFPTPEHAALLMVQVINAFTGACETAALAAIEAEGGHSLQQAMADTQAQWEQSAQSVALQFHGASS